MLLCADGVLSVQHSLFDVHGGMCTEQCNSRGLTIMSARHQDSCLPESFQLLQ